MSFLSYTIRWIGSNMAMPFWIVGHIHLSTNVYEDIYEIIASVGMNVIVALAFWLEWRDNKKNKVSWYYSNTVYIIKKYTMGAEHLTQQEKAKLYDDMLLRYQRLQEQVRQIKAKNFEVSDEDQRQINMIEASMKRLYNDTQKLF